VTAVTSEQVWAAFEFSDRARDWLRSPATPVIVQVETPSNPAVGDVPWGPAAAGATTALAALPRGAKVAVVGRGLERRHPAWRLAERLRGAGWHTIVVECGWPRGGADVVTFGGSRLVGRALAQLLGVDGPG
jgi:beta-N-acetylhexosaminidase